jgi:hypothetical protein
MGACCSTDEDKGNINIDRKGGDKNTKSKVDKRGGTSPIHIIFSINQLYNSFRLPNKLVTIS